MEKIKYLGHIIDKDGRRPDPERTAAIKDMLAPGNIASFIFLGLVDYYYYIILTKYSNRICMICVPSSMNC